MAACITLLDLVWRHAVVAQTVALIFFGIPFCAAQLPVACPASCKDALVHFVVSPDALNNVTLGSTAQNFHVALQDVAGANNYDLEPSLDTLGDVIVPPGATLRVPLPSCSCKRGNYSSDGITYTVQQGDYLYSIAQYVYGALLSFQDIVRDNNIKNPDLILPDQVFNITIPCTCLRSNASSTAAVALAYSVRINDDYESIAQQFNTSVTEIESLNPFVNASNLMQGEVLQLSLPACTFNLSSTSLDKGLTVAYDAYAITAGSCVQCKCSRDRQSSCVPAPATLPACSYNLTCPGTDLTIGESMVSTLQRSNSSCQFTTCVYNGYNTSGILTRLEYKTVAGACPAPPPPPPAPSVAPPPPESTSEPVGSGPLLSPPPPNSALGRNFDGASRDMLAFAALLTLFLTSV